MARTGSPSMAGEGLAASPPPPIMSKRDKRRSMLSERLDQMFETFGQNLRQQYDAQSSAIQVDVHLIMRENPYTNKPLDDDMETVEQKIQDITGGKVPGEGVAADSFRHDVGQEYVKFVQDINNSMEEKDVNLKLLWDKYQSNRKEVIKRHTFHTQVAHEEHDFLAATLRQRLINQVTKKKERLQKEKEQLDIGDSNAFLLHPNHFSLANPASPGGAHKRATRNTGRKGVEPEEPVTFDHRRKRKAFTEEIEGQSPAPASKYDVGANGNWSSQRNRSAYTQFEASVYSFSELFTENELNMAMNNSIIAAQNYLLKQGQASGRPNGEGANGAENGSALLPATEHEVEADATPSAMGMERTSSQSYHQTRGVTRSAMSELAAAAVRENPLEPALPTIILANRGQKAGGAPSMIANLNQVEIDQDLAIFANDRTGEYDWSRALDPAPPMEYQYDVRQRQPEVLEAFSSLNPAIGGVPMSAQSSMAGFSEPGGQPMSRQTSAMGGSVMKRTASGRSLLNDGRRGRSRFQ